MAKKAKAKDVAPKKRKSSVSPAQQTATAEEGESGPPLGSVTIAVQVWLKVENPSPFDEFVVEWATLGLSEEPDKIVDRSGNSHLLDPDRSITTSDEGLHIYMKPPLAGAGTYGFNLLCTYNEAVKARTAAPPEEDDEHREAA